jgi:hypothetical protein
MNAMVVALALTALRRHLGASLADLEWTVSAYTLKLRGVPDARGGARRVAGSPPGLRSRAHRVRAGIGSMRAVP